MRGKSEGVRWEGGGRDVKRNMGSKWVRGEGGKVRRVRWEVGEEV